MPASNSDQRASAARSMAAQAIGLLAVWFTLATVALVDAAEREPAAAEPATPAAVYGEGVRSTPWRTPEEERHGFHLPPGFEIRCYAAEPDIAKPLNLAFDESGRMWLTQTTTYPHPHPDGHSADDAVMVLEDHDGDGSADEIRRFAGDLNIPIGVLPYGDGCLCFSIPNIWYLRDTDGDGVCDRRDVVLGPFDTSRDTHGMINALRDGHDGWIYACHGFNNRSEVAGKDGHRVRLESGNTFRFRPDGSRVELVTRGQVNPFGMTEDDWGYRYSADCHSKPITQLIHGACYPSFGRPHDGLGFLPPMIEHLHGSTAISGIAYVSQRSSIVPLRNQFISGNVMTSRLNRNRLSYRGATARGEALADFLTSDDPWFRPVDVRVGPDGHLYVADFYNRIIGHYEVPLDHPGRDRTSGRVWQIRYTPTADEPSAEAATSAIDAAPRPVASHLVELSRHSASVDQPDEFLRQQLSDTAWERTGPRRRVALIRWASEQPSIHEFAWQRFSSVLAEPNPHVARAAAEALGKLGGREAVEPLLRRLIRVPESDVVLKQTVRIAIRNVLGRSGGKSLQWLKQIPAVAEDSTTRDTVASIMLGLPNAAASEWLLDYLQSRPDRPQRDALLEHAARHADDAALKQCVGLSRELAGDSLTRQAALLDLIVGDGQSDAADRPVVRQWASEIAVEALRHVERHLESAGRLVGWTAIDHSTGEPSEWPRQRRPLGGGGHETLFSSHPLGERYRGSFRSDAFPAPDTLSFWVAGHNGHPRHTDSGSNRVRLLDAESREVLREALPPRSDTAAQVRWDLAELNGRAVRLELLDRDDANAYAWIAAGRFEPRWIQASRPTEDLRLAMRLVDRHDLRELDPEIGRLALERRFSSSLRLELATGLSSVRRSPEAKVVLQTGRRLAAGETGSPFTDELIENLFQQDRSQLDELTELLLARLDGAEQKRFTKAWVSEGGSAQRLTTWVQRGQISIAAVADPEVAQRLSARLPPSKRGQLDKWTAEWEAVSGDAVERIDEAERLLAKDAADLGRGAAIFNKHCAACHQLRGQGKVVGPQLDGVLTRSDRRLLEDILTPNRNVDAAFRTVSLLLDDGRVLVGAIQTEDDRQIRLVDDRGEPSTVDPQAVQLRQDSRRSLMPANFGELLSTRDVADLVGFIRGKK